MNLVGTRFRLRHGPISLGLAGVAVLALAGYAAATPAGRDATRMPHKPHAAPTYTLLNETAISGRTFEEWKNDSNGKIHARLLGARGEDEIAIWLCLAPNGEKLLGTDKNPNSEHRGTTAFTPSQRGIAYRVSIKGKAYDISPTLGGPTHLVTGPAC